MLFEYSNIIVCPEEFSLPREIELSCLKISVFIVLVTVLNISCKSKNNSQNKFKNSDTIVKTNYSIDENRGSQADDSSLKIDTDLQEEQINSFDEALKRTRPPHYLHAHNPIKAPGMWEDTAGHGTFRKALHGHEKSSEKYYVSGYRDSHILCMTYKGDYLCRGIQEYGQTYKPKDIGYVHKVVSVTGDTCIHHDNKLKCIGEGFANKGFPSEGITDVDAHEDLLCIIAHNKVLCNDVYYNGDIEPTFLDYKHSYNRLVDFSSLQPKLINPKNIKVYSKNGNLDFPTVCVEDEKKIKCWGDFNKTFEVEDINSYSIEISDDQLCVLSVGQLECLTTTSEPTSSKREGTINEFSPPYDKYINKLMMTNNYDSSKGVYRRWYLLNIKSENHPTQIQFEEVKVSDRLICGRSEEVSLCWFITVHSNQKSHGDLYKKARNASPEELCSSKTIGQNEYGYIKSYNDLFVCLPKNIKKIWTANSSSDNQSYKICYSIENDIFCLERRVKKSKYIVETYVYEEFDSEPINFVETNNFSCFLLKNNEVVCKGGEELKTGVNPYYYRDRYGYERQDMQNYVTKEIEEISFPAFNLESIKSANPGTYEEKESSDDNNISPKKYFVGNIKCLNENDNTFQLFIDTKSAYEAKNKEKYSNFAGRTVYNFKCQSDYLKNRLDNILTITSNENCKKSKDFNQVKKVLDEMFKSIVEVENLFSSLIGSSQHKSCNRD